jgi:hypothetical protein
MIESRYKIEYVLPDDGNKKSNTFRNLAYLLLIPIVLSVVAAITYNFSLKNLSEDAISLYQKIKVQALDLDTSYTDTISQAEVTTTKAISQKSDEDNSNLSNQVTFQNDLPEDVVITSEKAQDLIKQNKAYSEASDSQSAENAELAESLNDISEKLVIERSKNETLNQQLAKQEEATKKLSIQLKDALEKSKEAETVVASTLNKEIIKPKENTEITTGVEIGENKTTSSTEINAADIVSKDLVGNSPIDKSDEPIKDEPTANNTDDKAKQASKEIASSPKTTPVDAIIQAMKGIQTSPAVNLENKLQVNN